METKVIQWTGYTANQLIHKFYKRCAAGLLMMNAIHYQRFQLIIARNNGAIVKVACIFLATRYFERFLSQWRDIRFKLPHAPQKNLDTEDKPKIDGRNVEDIAAFLLETGWLRIEDLKKYFKVDAQRVKKLGTNLERVGILKKWPNNARVLATTNQDYILEVLLSSSDSDRIGLRTETGIDYKPQPIEE